MKEVTLDDESSFAKHMTAEVMLRNDHDAILLIRHERAATWRLPLTSIRANERPHAAAKRCVRRTLGLEIHIGRLVCVDWMPPRGSHPENLIFLFDGGRLSPRGLHQPLAQQEFVPADDLADYLRPPEWRRARAAIMAKDEGMLVYLEDGRSPDMAVKGLLRWFVLCSRAGRISGFFDDEREAHLALRGAESLHRGEGCTHAVRTAFEDAFFQILADED